MFTKEVIAEYLGLTFLGNTLHSYMISVLVFFLGIAGLTLFKVFFVGKLKKFFKKTNNNIDDLLIEFFEGFKFIFYIAVSLYLALKVLDFTDTLDIVINNAFLIVLVLQLIFSINKVVKIHITKEIEKRKEKEELGHLSLLRISRTVIFVFVWILGILFLLSNMGVKITPIIASLGVGGIAIAFALQRILEDLFSSFTIYLDKPFQEGDFIVIGQDMGKVKKIGLKTTRIEALNGHELVVSNTELTSTRVNNYKKMEKRRVLFNFGILYDTSVEKVGKVNEIIKGIIDRIPDAEFDRSHFKELGDFSLNFEVVYYVKNSDMTAYLDAQQWINFDLMKAFESEGIQFAYPTQTIEMKK